MYGTDLTQKPHGFVLVQKMVCSNPNRVPISIKTVWRGGGGRHPEEAGEKTGMHTLPQRLHIKKWGHVCAWWPLCGSAPGTRHVPSPCPRANVAWTSSCTHTWGYGPTSSVFAMVCKVRCQGGGPPRTPNLRPPGENTQCKALEKNFQGLRKRTKMVFSGAFEKVDKKR